MNIPTLELILCFDVIPPIMAHPGWVIFALFFAKKPNVSSCEGIAFISPPPNHPTGIWLDLGLGSGFFSFSPEPTGNWIVDNCIQPDKQPGPSRRKPAPKPPPWFAGGSAVLWGMSSVDVGPKVPFEKMHPGSLVIRKASVLPPYRPKHMKNTGGCSQMWETVNASQKCHCCPCCAIHSPYILPSLCSVLNLMLWKLFCSIFLIPLIFWKLSAEHGFAARHFRKIWNLFGISQSGLTTI